MSSEKSFHNKNQDSLVIDAYHRLEEMIVTCELKPNMIVTEKELSEHLNIGRTPVREALKKLEMTHAILFLPRKGILIRVVSVDELLQQLNVRSVLEDLAVKYATLYATPAERQQLFELAKEYRILTKEWHPAIEALRVDNKFNHLLCQCTRNPFISDTLLPLHTLARRNYYLNYFIDKNLTEKVNLLHADLMDAIADSNMEEAISCNNRLLEAVQQFSSLSLKVWIPDIGTSSQV